MLRGVVKSWQNLLMIMQVLLQVHTSWEAALQLDVEEEQNEMLVDMLKRPRRRRLCPVSKNKQKNAQASELKIILSPNRFGYFVYYIYSTCTHMKKITANIGTKYNVIKHTNKYLNYFFCALNIPHTTA
jgi:hypothetical protein